MFLCFSVPYYLFRIFFNELCVICSFGSTWTNIFDCWGFFCLSNVQLNGFDSSLSGKLFLRNPSRTLSYSSFYYNAESDFVWWLEALQLYLHPIQKKKRIEIPCTQVQISTNNNIVESMDVRRQVQLMTSIHKKLAYSILISDNNTLESSCYSLLERCPRVWQ